MCPTLCKACFGKTASFVWHDCTGVPMPQTALGDVAESILVLSNL